MSAGILFHLGRGRGLLEGEKGCLRDGVWGLAAELGIRTWDQGGEVIKLPLKWVRMAFMSLTPSYSIDPAQNLLSTGPAGEIEM